MQRTIGLTIGLVLAATGIARADAPAYMPLQGTLAHRGGDPVDGDTPMRFALYTSNVGGTELWNETQTVLVEQGRFTAFLGDATPLDLALFRDHGSVYLGIAVDGDAEMNRFQVASTGFAAFAQYAGQAASLSRPVDWSDLSGIPADLADGVDNDTTYAAGAGLTLSASNVFSADRDTVEAWARAACYDTPAELRAVLDSLYAPIDHATSWATLIDVPPGFADGTDNDTRYAAGAGLALTGTTFSVRDEGITGTMIADGTIGRADANADFFIRRITRAQGYGTVTAVGILTGRTLTVTKMAADTSLRITYVDNIGFIMGDTATSCSVEVLLDGAPCAVPGPLLMHFAGRNIDHLNEEITPVSFVGTCSAIPAGSHTIAVRASGSCGRFTLPVAGAGGQLWVLEAEEVF
jgi:hypothetical protein